MHVKTSSSYLLHYHISESKGNYSDTLEAFRSSAYKLILWLYHPIAEILGFSTEFDCNIQLRCISQYLSKGIMCLQYVHKISEKVDCLLFVCFFVRFSFVCVILSCVRSS